MIFILFFTFSGTQKWKFAGISSPYSPLWLTRFQIAKMSKAQCGRVEIWMKSWIFLLQMTNRLFTVRLSTNHSNSILVHFVGCLWHALQTLANQWLPNYHVNMISSNILSVSSFSLASHTIAVCSNTPEQAFEAK